MIALWFDWLTYPNGRMHELKEEKLTRGQKYDEDENLQEKQVADTTVSTFHGGFASGGDMIAARRRHIREAEVAAIGTFDL